ncbi:hypothetical protein GCM10008018_48290 [Paenibacillus marchantiophytorum]|uniref:TATA-box binding protein n=1 Tax=Paenibacillus marchantiophytorum TaxID=1619310 RepID=A0ABQ1F265_9BACL|nr:YwmB family TATA-box binding protein [Paenibacillus marchantiophytorum]GFZ96287.1 hypothetical protein GCM10008018_48290 [Paenibacillus marchantiophytorum]
MQKIWLISFLCLSIAGLIFGWVRQADAHGEQETLQLLNTVRPYMTSENQITFKYTGYYGACGGLDQKMLEVGKELSQKLGLPQTAVLGESNDHPIYTAAKEVVSGAEATITVASPSGQAGCYTVLRLDASPQSEQSELIKWQDQADEQLKKLGIQGQWNVMVQGYAVEQDSAGLMDSDELVNRMVRAFKGNIVERYEDQNTVSMSLASEEFQTSIQSGNNKVNLQIALHQESTSGLWRLTVGTPIITMEY